MTIDPPTAVASSTLPTIDSASNSVTYTASPSATQGVPASVANGFAAAESLDQAFEILVDGLEQDCELIAAVLISNDQIHETDSIHALRSRGQDPRSKPIKNLISLCRQSAEHNRPIIRRQLLPDHTSIAFPIPFALRPGQAIGVITAPPENSDRLLVQALSWIHGFSTWQLEKQLQVESQSATHSAAAVEIICKVLQQRNRRDACQVIVSELAEHLQMRRMAIGIGSQRSGGCRIVAISDAVRVGPSADLIRSLESVLEQTLVFNESICIDLRDRPSNSSGKAWDLARQQNANLVTVPLIDDSQGVKAALLAIAEPDPQVVEIQNVLLALQPALVTLLSTVDRTTTSGTAHRLITSIRSRSGIAAMTAAFIAIGSMFLPIVHRETCCVTIEPHARRFVSAPFETTLLDCDVVPGDMVQINQKLATLEGREILLERNILQTEHDQAVKKRDSAQASHAYTEQRIAELEIDGIRSKLQLLDHRLGSLQLRSPIDGIVVTGDLKRAIGTPLTTGQQMFEIAPLDQMTAEVSVLDDQVAYVEEKQMAELFLDAYPSRSWQTQITTINPRSEIRDQQNVFIAECTLSNPNESLRPGMRGKIKIDCGRRRLGWVLFHRPLESIYAWLWG